MALWGIWVRTGREVASLLFAAPSYEPRRPACRKGPEKPPECLCGPPTGTHTVASIWATVHRRPDNSSHRGDDDVRTILVRPPHRQSVHAPAQLPALVRRRGLPPGVPGVSRNRRYHRHPKRPDTDRGPVRLHPGPRRHTHPRIHPQRRWRPLSWRPSMATRPTATGAHSACSCRTRSDIGATNAELGVHHLGSRHRHSRWPSHHRIQDGANPHKGAHCEDPTDQRLLPVLWYGHRNDARHNLPHQLATPGEPGATLGQTVRANVPTHARRRAAGWIWC
jgi:hypothetical protein